MTQTLEQLLEVLISKVRDYSDALEQDDVDAAKQAILDREKKFQDWLDFERQHAYERAVQNQNDSADRLVFLSESDAFDEALHYLRTGERKYVAGSEPDES